MSPFVKPGDSTTFDYDLRPYTWNGKGTTPYYVIETQLVDYSAPNFTLDAAIDQIKSPSQTDLFRRMNPVCGNPVVTIRNTGSMPLTSATITYGIEGGVQRTYQWTGNLKFLQTADVELGPIIWAAVSTNFVASISGPNGVGEEDDYPYNNSMRTSVTIPTVYPSRVVFELKTNKNPEETTYQIRDVNGNVVFERKNLEAVKLYSDTLDLQNGCYEFRLLDAGGNGLAWWADTAAGNGSMRVRDPGTKKTLRTFDPDFGSEIYQQFNVGALVLGVPSAPETGSHISLYPNPTSGTLNLRLDLPRRQDALITVNNLLGQSLLERTEKDVDFRMVTLDLSGLPPGTYIVSVQTGTEVVSRKVVVGE